MMEGLAGFGMLFVLFWLIGSLVILSIAIDSARSVRRSDKIIKLLEEQNRYLTAMSANIAKTTASSGPRAA
jgi:hypothetical protein